MKGYKAKACVALIIVSIAIFASVSFRKHDGPKAADLPLEITAWYWTGTVDHEGTLSTPMDPKRFPLYFEEGKYIGGTDCSAIKGTYVKDGEVLSLTPPELSSHQACPEGKMQDGYLKSLALATSYSIVGDELVIILYKDAGSMSFKASRFSNGSYTR